MTTESSSLPVGFIGLRNLGAPMATRLLDWPGGQRLAEAAGLNICEPGKVVRHSDAVTAGPGAIMLRDTTAPIDPNDFTFPILGHVGNLGEKDLFLALEPGDRLAVPLPLPQPALGRLAEGLGVGESLLDKEAS